MARRQTRSTVSRSETDELLKKTRLRIGEAADLLEVTPRTVRRYLDDGKLIPVRTPGGHRRVLTSSVRKWM